MPGWGGAQAELPQKTFAKVLRDVQTVMDDKGWAERDILMERAPITLPGQ